jgi:hypothetical protein
MNNTCYSIEEITQELPFMVIQFIYTYSYTDISDYLNPIKYYFAADIITGLGFSTRHDEYYLKPLEVQTDDGFILPSYSSKNSFQLDSKTNYLRSYNGLTIFELFISCSNLKDIYQRKYIKIQEIIANIGGFIKCVMMFFTVVNDFISSKMKFLSIILSFENKLKHHYRQIDRKSLNSTSKSSVDLRINNYVSDTFSKIHLLIIDKMIEKAPSLPDFKMKKVIPLTKLKRSDIFSILFNFNKEKSHMIENVEKFYIFNLDVMNLLLGIYKIEVMEELLLKNASKTSEAMLLINIIEGVLSKNAKEHFQKLKIFPDNNPFIEITEAPQKSELKEI